MQLVTAFVPPSKVYVIRTALRAFGFPRLTVSQAACIGERGDPEQIYRGAIREVGLRAEARIEIVVQDEDAHEIVDLIRRVALTGTVDDGAIWLMPVGDVKSICPAILDVDAW